MLHRHEHRPGEVEALGAAGYFVRDGFLGAELAHAVRVEAGAQSLHRAGIRHAHTLDALVRTDEITWLTAADTTGAMALAVGCFTELMGEMNERAWLGLRSFDLQLSRYQEGGKYARHRDAFPGQDNRRLTAIVYLNEGWIAPRGGRLQLFLEPPVLVDPVIDRLVVFRSELVEHEVLESHAERWALTAWFSAR